MLYDLTASIVIYRNEHDILLKSINSFLKTTLKKKLFLIDNSPTDKFNNIIEHQDVEYIFNDKNVGFGKGHNMAINKTIESSKYHLVLNPDVYFDAGVLEKIWSFMEENNQVGLLMPKVLYPNGNIQYLCKLLPVPVDFFIRRGLTKSNLAIKRNEKYELRFSGYDKIMNVPHLSGCFMFLRNSALQEVGLFDERFFMYVEDIDLSRRIHQKFKTIYYPKVNIYHYYQKGSYKELLLTFYNFYSVIKYFNKYGWFSDKIRDQVNKKAIIEIKKT